MYTVEELIEAFAKKESNNGRHPNTYVKNNHGAFGKMQITEATFRGLQREKKIPADWRHDVPEHADAAGAELVRSLYKQYNGDPVKMAAAYYAGPKAVRGDTIINYRDLKNPNFPDVQQYVSDFTKLLGIKYDQVIEPDEEKRYFSGQELYTMNRRPDVDLTQDNQAVDLPQATAGAVPTAAVGPDMLGAVDDQAEAAVKFRKEIDSTSFLDVARASWMRYDPLGVAVRKGVDAAMKPEFEPTPGWRPSPELMEGRSAEEQAEMLETGSEQEALWVRDRQDWRREAEDVVGREGLGTQLAAGFLASAPSSFVAGVGTARALYKAGYGSLALAQSGQRGAAVASLAAENVGAGLAMTGAVDLMDGYTDPADYAVGALFDLSLGFLGLPAHLRLSREAASFSKAAMDSVQEVEATLMAARVRTGEGAPSEAVHSEAHRDRVQAVQEMTGQGTGGIDPTRRLITDEDNAAIFYKEEADVEPEPKAYGGGDMEGAMARRADEVAEQQAPMDLINKQTDDNRIVSYVPESAPAHVKDSANAAVDMARALLPDHVRVGVVYIPGQPVSGVAKSVGPVVRIGVSDVGTAAGKGVEVAIHEVGHAINSYYLPNYKNKAALLDSFGKFLATVKQGDLEKAAWMRWASPAKGQKVDPGKAYDTDFDEWLAEQITKVVRDEAAAGNDVGLRESLAKTLREWVQRIMKLFTGAKDKGYIPADQSVVDFVAAIRNREVEPVKFARPVQARPNVPTPDESRAAIMNDPIARKYGIDLLPMGSPAERARAKAILALYKKADGYPKPDEKRLNSLLSRTMFADSTVRMLKSNNPIARMVASELLESASGATKRQATAAIGKYMMERKMLGNSLQTLESFYRVWRNDNGGNVAKDFLDGKHWENFNKQVATYIESKGAVPAHPAVKQAAEEVTKAYDRIRMEQVNAKTLGWQALPETSEGYMPHKMSPAALRQLSVEQLRVLHSALTDQFITIEGFDMTFADSLATKYIERIRQRALGGYHASVGNGHADLDVLDELLDQPGELKITPAEAQALKKRLRNGSAGYTKGRLKLDLLKEHTLPDGSTFKLLDVFETDQRFLLRQQAGRASGEVALARHGILGKPGLQLLRSAMELGDNEFKAQMPEFEAFDQVSAEFLNEPFGTHSSKWLDRVMYANSLARLGGMFFTQLGEFTNGVAHLGVAKTLQAVPQMRRLRAEAKALARGEKVDNPVLSSLEAIGGADFGSDAYKFAFPFDDIDKQYQVYGQDTLTLGDKLLRGGVYAQGKLSFWRALHSAQQRGMAEQIVHKAIEYMRAGKDDVALADMGFTPEFRKRFLAELPNVAQFDANGRLVRLDLGRSQDVNTMEEFVQAVHRGTNQIIQGTFIGETGKWAHEGLLRFMTQFRTFSLTAIEKQWTRQMNNHGTLKGLGILLGTIAAASPIYIARTYVNSVGREDQEEYLDKMLAPAMIARASLNYVAMSGLAGDFLDAFTVVSGTGEITGARSGVATGFVGTVIAPGAGWVDDVWKGIQNTKDGTDPSALLKTLPFANIPYIAAPVRALTD